MADVKDLVSRYDNPLIRALVQAIPVLGGPVDTLVAGAVDSITKDRARVFFDELANGAHALNEQTIQSEPFLHAYFCTAKAALNTRQREKIQCFARLLAAATRGEIDFGDAHEELLAMLDEATYPELQVSAYLADLEDSRFPRAMYERLAPETDVEHTMRLWPEFIKYFGDTAVAVIRARLARLARTGLYEPLTTSAWDYEGGMGRATPMYRRLADLIRPSEASSPLHGPGSVVLELTRFDRTDSDFVNNQPGEHIAKWSVSGSVRRREAQRVVSALVLLEVVDATKAVTNSVRHQVTIPEDRPGNLNIEFSDRVVSANHRARVRVEEVRL
jgi:hypothetical protein